MDKNAWTFLYEDSGFLKLFILYRKFIVTVFFMSI